MWVCFLLCCQLECECAHCQWRAEEFCSTRDVFLVEVTACVASRGCEQRTNEVVGGAWVALHTKRVGGYGGSKGRVGGSIRPASLDLSSGAGAIVLHSTSLYWFHQAGILRLSLFLCLPSLFPPFYTLICSLPPFPFSLSLSIYLFRSLSAPLGLFFSSSRAVWQQVFGAWRIMYTHITFSHLSVDAYWFWYHNEIYYFPCTATLDPFLPPSLSFQSNVIKSQNCSTFFLDSIKFTCLSSICIYMYVWSEATHQCVCMC